MWFPVLLKYGLVYLLMFTRLVIDNISIIRVCILVLTVCFYDFPVAFKVEITSLC